MGEKAAIGLGSNVASSWGGPAETLVEAVRRIGSDSVSVTAVSRFFGSPAYPPGSGSDYVNAAAMVETTLDPSALLARLMQIEAVLGRVRGQRWASRTADLDLLLFGQAVLPDRTTSQTWMTLSPERQMTETPAQLILPHPRLQDRGFVLIPLAEIAPAWRHPLTGRTVRQMAEDLPEAAKAGVRPI